MHLLAFPQHMGMPHLRGNRTRLRLARDRLRRVTCCRAEWLVSGRADWSARREEPRIGAQRSASCKEAARAPHGGQSHGCLRVLVCRERDDKLWDSGNQSSCGGACAAMVNGSTHPGEKSVVWHALREEQPLGTAVTFCRPPQPVSSTARARTLCTASTTSHVSRVQHLLRSLHNLPGHLPQHEVKTPCGTHLSKSLAAHHLFRTMRQSSASDALRLKQRTEPTRSNGRDKLASHP